jgi:hypothetical protein
MLKTKTKVDWKWKKTTNENKQYLRYFLHVLDLVSFVKRLLKYLCVAVY